MEWKSCNYDSGRKGFTVGRVLAISTDILITLAATEGYTILNLKEMSLHTTTESEICSRRAAAFMWFECNRRGKARMTTAHLFEQTDEQR